MPVPLRVGQGYDVHALAEGLPLVLGGVTIPHTKGCVAHSDGDAVIHALCDALLGAAALGDIGLHFPDSDPAYAGISSRRLLRLTVEAVRKAGWQPANADMTVALQRPRLRPYVDTMRTLLAEDMGLTRAEVSVKATTTEQLGFIGREEGVEAWAVVLLERVADTDRLA